VLQGVTGSAAAPAAAASAALDAMYQQREIQVQRFDAKDYLAKVAPTDAEIEAYYKDPAHCGAVRAPEEAIDRVPSCSTSKR
jgi:peptidyl-prolyl cis-trans isomerase D